MNAPASSAPAWGCRVEEEEAASREAAMEAIRLVGLEKQANLPAASLPYGGQRLVEIARALTTKPRLLLLDEPCAGMHAEERAYLMERIGRIRKSGIAVLLVEHNMELVMGISDRVWVLDHGKLIASGRPEEVQRDAAVLEAYLGVGCGEVGQACSGAGRLQCRRSGGGRPVALGRRAVRVLWRRPSAA